MDSDSGRVPLAPGSREPSPDGLGPSGFDPSRGHFIKCDRCDGHGIVASWSFGVKEPDECPECYGSGRNWRYQSGLIAKHYAGPFLGRDSDEHPKDENAKRLSGEAVPARAEGIAQPSPDTKESE